MLPNLLGCVQTTFCFSFVQLLRRGYCGICVVFPSPFRPPPQPPGAAPAVKQFSAMLEVRKWFRGIAHGHARLLLRIDESCQLPIIRSSPAGSCLTRLPKGHFPGSSILKIKNKSIFVSNYPCVDQPIRSRGYAYVMRWFAERGPFRRPPNHTEDIVIKAGLPQRNEYSK